MNATRKTPASAYHAGPGVPAEVTGAARAVIDAVHEDMAAGRIPADVGSFSELHDHVDANEYLIAVEHMVGARPPSDDPGAEYAHDNSEHVTDALNRVSDLVDEWLAAEALALGTGARCPGRTCDMLVRFNGGTAAGGHWVHLDDGSHQCEPCQFCGPTVVHPDVAAALGVETDVRPRFIVKRAGSTRPAGTAAEWLTMSVRFEYRDGAVRVMTDGSTMGTYPDFAAAGAALGDEAQGRIEGRYAR